MEEENTKEKAGKTDKYILLSLDDERTRHLSDVLGNRTARKIVDFLAERGEASENDISLALGIPINTAEYNLKKLISAGLAEKAKQHFWSVKGKKITMYKISQRSIVISPKKLTGSRLKAFISTLIVSIAGALALRYYAVKSAAGNMALKAAPTLANSAESAQAATSSVETFSLTNISTWSVWAVFLAGTIFSLVVYFSFEKIVRAVRRSN